MRDCDAASGGQLLLAETLGLAMAKRAAEILHRHRAALTAGVRDAGAPLDGNAVDEADDAQFEADNAVFTAVLDAANECLGRYDTRPPDDRWCDALLHLIYLSQLSPGGATPRTPLLSPRGGDPRTPLLSPGGDPPVPRCISRGGHPRTPRCP